MSLNTIKSEECQDFSGKINEAREYFPVFNEIELNYSLRNSFIKIVVVDPVPIPIFILPFESFTSSNAPSAAKNFLFIDFCFSKNFI